MLESRCASLPERTDRARWRLRPGLATRPTSDRLRETLFNVLAPRMEGAVFLDLYAGSGAVGIEALSRGAAGVDFVERAPAALRVLRKNLARLGIDGGVPDSYGWRGSWLRRFAEAGWTAAGSAGSIWCFSIRRTMRRRSMRRRWGCWAVARLELLAPGRGGDCGASAQGAA